ncbi:hypothetical protein ACFQH6_20695 [Halobacteriaceae archaeon GCM10025711]
MTLTDQQQIARITVTGDPDGQGRRNFVFEAKAGGEEGLQVREYIRTGTIGGGSTINSFLQNQDILPIDGSLNQSIYLDLGRNQHIFELDFQGWQGSQYQWGDTGDDTELTATDATGEDPITQMQIFLHVLNNVQVDSLPEQTATFPGVGSDGPALLEFGQHTTDGVLDPVNVVFEDPGTAFSGSNPSSFDGTVTCIEAADLGQAWDTTENTKLG